MKKSKSILHSFGYALQGLVSAFRTERNMKVHVFMMIIVILLGSLLKITCFEWIVCILLFGGVIGAELINTAIEITVDLAMPEKHEKAKLAKDIAAAGVLVFAMVAAIIGGIIFIPKLVALL